MATHSKTSKPLPTTTVRQCRGGVFLPLKEISWNFKGIDLVTENQWGTVTLKKCRLTQTHQNILESIIVNAEIVRPAPDGRMAFVYSPSKVLRYMGTSPKNHTWLYDKLSDLLTTEIEIKTDSFRASGTILYEKRESKVPISGRFLPPRNRKGESIEHREPHYQVIVFHPFSSRLFDVDVALHYRDLLPAILRLKHAVTQALVRFCLSHDQVNMALDEVLMALGALNPSTPLRTRQHIKKNVRNELESLEREFGIEIRKMEDGIGGVFYKKHPKVWFESPEETAPKPVPVDERPSEPCSSTRRKGLIPTPEESARV